MFREGREKCLEREERSVSRGKREVFRERRKYIMGREKTIEKGINKYSKKRFLLKNFSNLA